MDYLYEIYSNKPCYQPCLRLRDTLPAVYRIKCIMNHLAWNFIRNTFYRQADIEKNSTNKYLLSIY
jgi:hypothetical protein